MSSDFDVHAYVRKVVSSHRNVSEIWLLGSRANGTATAVSDWDILAFADEPTFDGLRNDYVLHHPEVDLLVVKSADGRFEKPWGRKKSGSLEKWQWNRVSDTEATYRSTKFIPDLGETHHGDFYEKFYKAIRLWP